MHEWESFSDMVSITMGILKEDVEKGIVHMNKILSLMESPFNRM